MDENRKCLFGMDIGTTGIKAVIIDSEKGLLSESGSREHAATLNTNLGYSEFDTETWWEVTKEIIPEVISKGNIDPTEIKGICISALAPCITLMDKDGIALRPGMIWQDSRAPKGWERLFQQNPLYATGKILWVKENEPDNYEKCYKFLVNGESTINSKLTGKYTSNSGPERKDIMVEQFKKYNLKISTIPDFYNSTDVIGGVTKKAARETGFAEGTPVIAGQSDGAGARIGNGAVRDGVGSEMIGHSTGMSMSSHGERRGGGCSAGGAVLRWFRDIFSKEELEVAERTGLSVYNLLDREAEKIPPGSDGLIILPYFMGERQPLFNPYARGVIFGLNLTHGRGHFIRAILESSAYSIRRGVDAGGGNLADVKEIRATGGGSRSDLWLKIKASVIGIPYSRVEGTSDATCVGDAIQAGFGVGVFKDIESACDRLIKVSKVIEPDPEWVKAYNRYYPIFVEIYDQLKGTFDKLQEANIQT